MTIDTTSATAGDALRRLRELAVDPDVQCWPEKVDGGFMKLIEMRNLITAILPNLPDVAQTPSRIEALEAALRLAEEVLSQAPLSTSIWPNGMHPQRGITIIRAALAPEQDK